MVDTSTDHEQQLEHELDLDDINSPQHNDDDEQSASQQTSSRASSSNTATDSIIPEKPNQPVLSFPQRTIGRQKRSFCSSWYSKYPWLHYQVTDDSVLCFYCHIAEKRHLPISTNKDQAFTTTGFSNWKKAIERFNKHESSLSHHQSVDFVEKIPRTTQNVGEMLSSTYAQQKADNRAMLRIILSTIRFLGRQGLALRGRYKDQAQITSGGLNFSGEIDSNFIQLLKVRAEDNPDLLKWMLKSRDKFMSPDVQNEILCMMALFIQREIANSVSGQWYTIMVDETTDVSNTEQLVFCIRYVDSTLEVHEEFIGLYSLESTSAESIFSTVQDILLRMNLRIENCRGQCYDGASSMAGHKSGVAKKVMDLESRALYTHCYGHALNLAAQDSIKQIRIMEDTLDTTYEITKLIKKSPKREAIFQKIADEIQAGSPGIRVLCPTRWTVRAEAFTSISENYTALQSTWYAAKQATKDTEMKARITGVAAQMEKFEFFFGIEVGRKCLSMADNLSRALQSATISACEGQGVVLKTIQALQSIRSDENFSLFWKYLETRSSVLDISEPQLPRRKRAPRRYEIGNAEPEYPATAHDYYRRIYFEVIDVLVASIKARFDQQGFHMLQNLETILLDPTRINLIQDVCQFYGEDLNQRRLETQIKVLHTNAAEHGVNALTDVVSFLKGLNSVEREFYSEVIKVVKLIFVMPATNALSERSFSSLRRVKTWLRTTTNQVRLNSCMTLHVHKSRTDSLPLLQIGNEFIQRNSSRMHIFGLFEYNDC